MKKIMIVVGIVLLSIRSYAQTETDYLEISRDVLKVEKKAAIAEIMQLTDDECVKFWELYNEYESKNYTIQNKRIAIIKDFADSYENLSGEKADELLLKAFDFQAEVLKLNKTYYKKFKKIIPVGEASKMFQALSKIDNLVNAQLALEIPLLETK